MLFLMIGVEGVLSGIGILLLLDWSRCDAVCRPSRRLVFPIQGVGAGAGAAVRVGVEQGRRGAALAVSARMAGGVGGRVQRVSWGEAPDVGGPYTLFLPVDSAFSRFSGEALDAVVHDRSALEALVDAHIVPGSVTPDQLQQGTVLVSLQGEPIAAEWVGRPFVNAAAVIGSAELEHGVVHFIDRVL
jgi:hypothetical protein